MKTAVLFFLLIVPALIASQENPTREELLQTVRHIDALAKDTQNQLDQEKQAHAQVTMQLQDATKKSEFLQAAIDSMSSRCNKAIANLDHVVKKLHLAKFIMSGLALAVAAWVALQLPGPLKLYIGIPLGAAAVTAIWAFL